MTGEKIDSNALKDDGRDGTVILAEGKIENFKEKVCLQ
jgi:hypothetical protein